MVRSKRFWPLTRLQSAFYVLLIAAIALLILELSNTTHIFHSAKTADKTVKAVGTPLSRPKQNASQTSPNKTPASPSPAIGNGYAIDTKGQSASNTPADQWTTSSSGEITVKQPAANSTFKSGSLVVGTAKISEIHYRLIDNDSGVIAQGTLAVNNGSFSATLQFTHTASNGRLDVFSTEADGTEINEVQIGVNFD